MNKYNLIVKIKDRKNIICLVLFFLLYFISNYIWLKRISYPTLHDELTHLYIALSYFWSLQAHCFHNFFIVNSTHWPPFFYFSSLPFALISKGSYIGLVMTNMLYLLLLLFSVYMIGKKIMGTDVTILSICLLLFHPLTAMFSRMFMLDFALMALVSFGIICLIYSDSMQNIRWSLLFGISLGIGVSTKLSYLGFITLPFLYTIILGMLDKNKKTLFMNLFIVFIIALTIIFINALFFDYSLLFKISRAAFRGVNPFPYSLALIFKKINSLWIIFLLLGMIYFLKNPYFITIFLWLLPSFFITFRFQQERFLLPVVPVLALFTAYGILRQPFKKLRNIFAVLIVGIMLFQFLLLNFPEVKFRENSIWRIFIPEYLSIIGENPALNEFLRNDWRITRLLKSIYEVVPSLNYINPPVCITYDESQEEQLASFFRTEYLLGYSDKKKKIFSSKLVVYNIGLPFLEREIVPQGCLGAISEAKFFIVLSKSPYISLSRLQSDFRFFNRDLQLWSSYSPFILKKEFYHRLADTLTDFSLLKIVPLLHDTSAYIYKRNISNNTMVQAEKNSHKLQWESAERL